MGIHHETLERVLGRRAASARERRGIPPRPWLLLVAALAALSAPLFATPTAAASALARTVAVEAPASLAGRALPDVGATLPIAFGLLGLAVMGRRPREVGR